MFNTIEIDPPEFDRTHIEAFLPEEAQIAQEGFVKDAIIRIQYVFSSLLDVFKHLSAEASVEKDDALQQTLSEIKKDVLFIKKFPDQSAMPGKLNALGTTVIGVQPGFKSDLVSYIPDLTKACQNAEKSVLAELEKFNTVVANFVTNKNYRLTNTSLNSDIRKVAKTNEEITGTINHHFDYKAKSDGSVLLKDLVNSYSEVLKLEDQVHKLAATLPFKNILLVDAVIAKATEGLSALLEELKTEEGYSIALAKELALYTNEIAKACETMTMARFYMESTVKVYANVIKTIKVNI